jgi:hypothetical protein
LTRKVNFNQPESAKVKLYQPEVNTMRRIIQRTITTIHIDSFIYVEEGPSVGSTSPEPQLDIINGQPTLIPIEQPGDQDQPAIQP